jgi:hypothetical protein
MTITRSTILPPINSIGEAVNGFYAVDVAGGKVVPAKAAPKSGW